MPSAVFWIGVGLILLVGGYSSFRGKAEVEPGDAEAIADAMEDMTDGVNEENQNTKA